LDGHVVAPNGSETTQRSLTVKPSIEFSNASIEHSFEKSPSDTE